MSSDSLTFGEEIVDVIQTTTKKEKK